MNRKIALLFPGQGAQEVGMGRDLFGRGGVADELIERGSHEAGEDLARLCVRGPGKKLAETRYLQPALTALCLSLWRALVDQGLVPTVVAGHSVGEIPALGACGACDLQGAVRLAAIRGRLMGEAAGASPGGMVAISGLGFEEVAAILAPFQERGQLTLAAVNAPTQTAVSGDPSLLDELVSLLASRSELRVTRLRVSGAWHSTHMASAQEALAEEILAIGLADEVGPAPCAPMVFNRHGRERGAGESVAELIAGQLTSPVRWDLVVGRFAQMGITDYVEVGPGRVLRGLVRLNLPDPTIRIHSVADRRSLDRTVAALRSN